MRHKYTKFSRSHERGADEIKEDAEDDREDEGRREREDAGEPESRRSVTVTSHIPS
jgi:hypothetical protein